MSLPGDKLFASHKYQVPVILQDLPPAEALHQALDSLSHLDNVISDVFAAISERVKVERAKIDQINTRVARCSDKIQRISENQAEAITIYSACKYPAADELPLFEQLCTVNLAHVDAIVSEGYQPRKKHKISTALRNGKSKDVDTSGLFSELTDFRANRAEKRELDGETHDGLGRLPPYLPSVSSILLFNSTENPYKTYNSLDNLEGVGGSDRQNNNKQGLAEAPHTMVEGLGLPTFEADNMIFSPGMGLVPALNTMQNLPLGQLANINFGGSDQIQSIAPSMASLPDLPTFSSIGQQSSGNNKKQAPKQTQKKSASSSAPAASSGGTTSDATVVLSSSSSAAPPPPGPPPPGPPPPAPAPPGAPTAPTNAGTASNKPKAQKKKKKAASGGGSRGGLLDAIRNSGGAARKLRKVTKDIIDAAKEKPAPASGGGGMDLMSQLSMRLAKTRNVMTGKAEAKKSAVRGKRMSFIAPRPGKAGAKTELGLPKVVEEVMEQKRNAEHSDSDDAEEEWD